MATRTVTELLSTEAHALLWPRFCRDCLAARFPHEHEVLDSRILMCPGCEAVVEWFDDGRMLDWPSAQAHTCAPRQAEPAPVPVRRVEARETVPPAWPEDDYLPETEEVVRLPIVPPVPHRIRLAPKGD